MSMMPTLNFQLRSYVELNKAKQIIFVRLQINGVNFVNFIKKINWR